MKLKVVENNSKTKRSHFCKELVLQNSSEKKIKFSEFGKPYVNDLYFNVSHGDGISVLILGTCEVGIDIEKEKTIEVSNIIRNTEDLKISDIILHVIKESASKLVGEGLGIDFKEITVFENYCIYKNKIINYTLLQLEDNHICAITSYEVIKIGDIERIKC